MKSKKILVEVICLVLVLNFFYEGIYKLANLDDYHFWLGREPFLGPVAGILTYSIPIGEILLSLLFLFPATRLIALYSSLIGLILFILWIMSGYLFSHLLFWPHHALWQKPTWMQKMLISLGICWMSFMAIVLSRTGWPVKHVPS